jgi:integrase
MGTKSKRANGEGSVYRRADGKWVGSVSIQVPNQGLKRKVFYGKSKTEVREKVLAALNEKQKGTLIVAEQQTMQAYLEHWLEHTVKLIIRPRSYERYAEIVRLHIVPIMGKIKLQALAPQHVQMLQAQKTQEGLSSTTVAAIHGVLHKALEDAVKLGLVTRNVCDAISPPRKHHKEISPLTADQVRRLLEAAKGHPHEALFVLALATGMRRGELLGLKWQDINFTTGMLYVRRTLSRLPTQMGRQRGDLYIETEPKTKNSRRSIALAKFALEALEQHRKRQEKIKEQAGDYWIDNDYVFCDEYGEHLDPGYGALVQLKRLLKKAGLPDIRFHDLRHSAATLLLSMGVHPKIVQEILGHSEISMTMDVYSHVLPTMQREAVNRLNQIFMGSPSSPASAENQLRDPENTDPKEERAL